MLFTRQDRPVSVWARDLNEAGFPTVVAAPSKLQRPSGGRVKTDARDALHPARLLKLREIIGVRTPFHRSGSSPGSGPGAGRLPGGSDAFAPPVANPAYQSDRAVVDDMLTTHTQTPSGTQRKRVPDSQSGTRFPLPLDRNDLRIWCVPSMNCAVAGQS